MTGRGAQKGFTLTEILVAMSLLAIGMTGILSLFSAAVSMQRDATERMDVALLYPSVMAEVRAELTRLASGKDGSEGVSALNGVEVQIPSEPRYSYRVFLEDDPTDPTGRVVLCRVQVLAKVRGRSKVYEFGYQPVVIEADNDARIRDLLGR